MLRRLLTLMALAGCSGDDGPEWPVGDWRSNDPKFSCAFFLNLREDGYAEFKDVCVLKDGEVGVQISTGVYRLSGSRLLFSWSRSSCAGWDPSETLEVSQRDDDVLGLLTADGLLLFEPLEPGEGGGGGRATFGCYDGSLFTPSPLADL